MAKNRTIPFGYCMKNGEITTEPKEVYAVVAIFDEYLKGRSLSEIAKLMQSEKIRYNAISDKWNKNMVKRIIENEKYLGTDKYPQIIDDDTFRLANEKRIRKATTLDLIPDDLQKIRKRTYCSECGHRLSRQYVTFLIPCKSSHTRLSVVAFCTRFSFARLKISSSIICGYLSVPRYFSFSIIRLTIFLFQRSESSVYRMFSDSISFAI